jgi:hypothetical protein
MRGDIVKATDAHAIVMAPNMRQVEVTEVYDGLGMKPLDALLYSLNRSIDAYSWIVEGRVACMFGVGVRDIISKKHIPWLLTTSLVEKYPVDFLRASRFIFHHFNVDRQFELSSFVDSRHVKSVQWLKWLGFAVNEANPLKITNLDDAGQKYSVDFYPFEVPAEQG